MVKLLSQLYDIYIYIKIVENLIYFFISISFILQNFSGNFTLLQNISLKAFQRLKTNTKIDLQLNEVYMKIK